MSNYGEPDTSAYAESAVPTFGAGTMAPVTAGRRMSIVEVQRYVQYLALTGQLDLLSFQDRRDLMAWMQEQGIDPTSFRQVNRGLQVQLDLGRSRSGRPQSGPVQLSGSLAGGGTYAEDEGRPSAARFDRNRGRTRFGIHQIFTAPWQELSQDEYNQLQRMLFDAGLYSSEAPPVWGDRSDPGFREAWGRAITELYAQGNSMSMDDFLAQKAQTAGPVEEAVQFDTEIIQLTDAATIRQVSDEIAQSELGRKLTDDEKATLVGIIHQLETGQQQAAIDVDTGNLLGQAGYNMGQVSGNITADQVLQTGTALGAQYGLSVTSHIRSPAHNAAIGGARNSDHLTGMAVDLSGSPGQMATLAAWAHANEGPGKLFRWVGWSDSDPSGGHDDHVHLSFNSYVGEGADIGGQLGTVSGGTTTSGLEQFMAATRQIESGGDYNVTNSIGAYGAYQFMPGTWSSAAAMAGIDPSDRSPGAQDAAARALMSSYFQRYGDWRLVAVAWHGGQGLADAYKNNLDGLRSVGDGNISTYDYMMKVMEAMGSGATGGLPGPMTTSIQGVDYQAQLIEEIRRRNPTEAESHDLALQFESFKNLGFSGAQSGGGVF